MTRRSRRRSFSRLLTAFLPGLLLAAAASAPAGAQVIGSYFAPLPAVLGPGGFDTLRQTAGRDIAGGVRAGAFVIRPNLTENLGYTSNVEGKPGGRGSAIVDTHAGILALTDHGRTNMFVNLIADDHRALDLPRQSHTDWSASTGATFTLGRDTLSATYAHLVLSEQPGELDSRTIIEPVPFQVDDLQLSYAALGAGRLTFTPDFQVTRYQFQDIVAGGNVFSQAFLDRTALQGGVTARYELAPQRDLLLVVRGTHLSYRTGTPVAPPRDSDGGLAMAGIDYAQSGANLRYRLLAGLQGRRYTSRAYDSQLAPILEASVTWTPTRLTTVALLARRDIQDTEDENIAGFTLTAARLSVTHELRRDLRLNGYVEVQHADYAQSRTGEVSQTGVLTVGRTETLYRAGGGVTWPLNARIRAGVRAGVTDHEGRNGSYLSNTTVFSLDLGL